MTLKPSWITRRKFIANSVFATIVSRGLRSQDHARASANDKLNIGIIGAGGRGEDNLNAVRSENIVALCDCDFRRAANSFKQFPKATRYQDWRKMLDEEKTLDAVVVSTPDH